MLKLTGYLKPYKFSISVIVAFMLAMAVAELTLPLILADMINNGMMRGDSAYVLQKGGFMLLVALASSACSIVGTYMSARVALGIGRDLRFDIFKRVSSYSLAEFDKIGTASLITRTTNDVTQVQMSAVMIFRFFIYSPLVCAGGIIMALSVDTELTKILLIALPVMLLLIIIVAKYIIPLFKKMQENIDRLTLILRENLTGVRVIRAFARGQYEKERFGGANKDLTGLAVRVNRIMAFMQPVVMLIMNATALFIVWFGGARVFKGDIEIGDMMAFLQYAMLIMFSIIMVTMMFVMIPRAEASAARINEALSLAETVHDTGTRLTADTNGTVEFRNVTYRYSGAEQPALLNISFTANAGETTAIIGGTGAGKSTLVNLIPRFYDVESGQVLVDGVDVREQPVSHLREKLGFVTQTAVIFSGTAMDNIKYGKDGTAPEEIINAAKTAQADGFISEMENGYDSPLSRGGTNLSGGQKQRISIARALIRKPEIYIFDDCFSALDFKTDAMLRAALSKEAASATKIIIAQRISTVMDADKIIVLSDGEIAGTGTHKELLKTCEVYREIAETQLSLEELSDG